MEDAQFIEQIKAKIERLVGRPIELGVDKDAENPVALDMSSPTPKVMLGPQVVQFPGLTRMAIEYVVACIRKEQPLDPLEFQMLLRRN
jgi:hypothetical protein